MDDFARAAIREFQGGSSVGNIADRISAARAGGLVADPEKIDPEVRARQLRGVG